MNITIVYAVAVGATVFAASLAARADEPAAPAAPQPSPAAPAAAVATATPAPVPAAPALASEPVTLGGYAEAYYDHQSGGNESATATLRRVVLYVGHRFDDRIRFYSELELENARDAEIEQGYLEFAVASKLAVRAGLQLVPMGIVNVTHEPPTFLTVDRPLVDELIIPSTWRELGVGVTVEPAEGLRVIALLSSGLDGDQINATTGLTGARGQGANAHAQQAAGTLRLEYEPILGVRAAASGYFGGARADVAELPGVTVGIAEADAQVQRNGIRFRAEYARVYLQNADEITDLARASDPTAAAVGSQFEGYYAELGYDVLHPLRNPDGMELFPFVRFESVNLYAQRADVPLPGVSSPKPFLQGGISWRIRPTVVVKADWRHFVGSGVVPPAGDLGGEPGEPAPTAGGKNRLMTSIGLSF
ncbi:MAG TPA: porin [bacterium]|nr:porin [bacterium]